ncbi:MAG: peptide ABC transporter substrate-binding protein [Chloroflexi bacterium]|nr:peptide ABC transporter substrate-binding protein [Chloroflexota bacterium]
MKFRISWLLLAAALFALAACGTTGTPAPTSAPAAQATKPAAGATAPAAAATPTAVAPKKGGKITMAVWQSPVTLNPLLGTQTVMNEVNIFVLEGMTKVLADGSRIASLAKEVPSVQNGGVSADGKTVTYKLKEGLKLSDGTSFTCEDVKFHWQATMTKDVGVSSTTGYSDIDTVECPDPLTAVVKYKTFFAPYLTLFNEIVPRVAGDPKDMKNWAFNRKPVGTGPFMVKEFKADDFITLDRNPNYREKDKPYLDQLIIRIVPSSEVALQLLKSGEVDIMWNNTEAELPELEKLPGIKVSQPLQIGGERIFLNLAENKDPSDPKTKHPILSDIKVRQALEYAINKQVIIDKLLFGKAKPGTSELNAGYWDCKATPRAFDANKAKQLLDEAGWKPGADGIRVKDGQRLRLKYSTTSGNKLREDSQVLIVENWKAVGIEAYIENAPSAVVIGTWDAASPRRRGNFDLIMYTTNAGEDPHSQMVNLFASWVIPSVDNKGGLNYTRFNDPAVDDLLKKAAAEPDTVKRKDMYCQVVKAGQDATNMIYLYQRLDIDSYRDRLQGWVENAWDNNGWNAENWWVSK